MKRLGMTLAGVVGAGFLTLGLWGVASAEDAAATHQYVGVKKCKTCHNSEKSGAQFKHWTDSKHSKTFAVLATEEAKKIATEKGIADPQKAAECLSCHVTGHGKPAEAFAATFVAEDGVGCESCHGPGQHYMKMKTMQAIRDGSQKGEELGLVKPTEETCTACHNDKSPTFKSFDFKAASEKIAHKIPEGFKRGAAAEGEAEAAK